MLLRLYRYIYKCITFTQACIKMFCESERSVASIKHALKFRVIYIFIFIEISVIGYIRHEKKISAPVRDHIIPVFYGTLQYFHIVLADCFKEKCYVFFTYFQRSSLGFVILTQIVDADNFHHGLINCITI